MELVDFFKADDYEFAISIGMVKSGDPRARAAPDAELLGSYGLLNELAEELLKDLGTFHRVAGMIKGFSGVYGALESLGKYMRNNCYTQIGRNKQFLHINPDELQVWLELKNLEDEPYCGQELIAIVRFK